MTERQLEQHIPILGWLHIIGNLVLVVIGGFLFLLLTTIGAVSGDQQAVAVLAVVGTFVGGFLIVLGLPGIVAGWGLLRRKSWARILALVVGILGLVNFPFGTAIGIYTLWVLLQPDAVGYFQAEKAPDA